ncbi:hypothetical protein B0H12DRAFT_1120484 [Mycena haematopus]|nr:hypothetical protein B0H12DRAFT_1120484 [Mycena haematopus]
MLSSGTVVVLPTGISKISIVFVPHHFFAWRTSDFARSVSFVYENLCSSTQLISIRQAGGEPNNGPMPHDIEYANFATF